MSRITHFETNIWYYGGLLDRWCGQLLAYSEQEGDSPFVAPVMEIRPEGGWWSWSRKGLERKLYRAIERQLRAEARRDYDPVDTRIIAAGHVQMWDEAPHD